MTLSDQTRIARHAARPLAVTLWQALAPLRSTVSFMNTGAHPDDETSAMLAAFGFRDGLDLSYACSTRGEGGQNDIGTEATEALGVLRTAEMERACDALNLRMYWLSETASDTIFDFGFSKSGKETLAKWDEARTLKRFVDIVRTERPDILCPTFLDIPGQHGHHRAMTEAAIRVFDLAADPAYTDSALPPWAVSKLYLPAWSGAGQAYDDDLPPPPATLTVPAKGIEPFTGFSWEMLGQQSRVWHRTQAMGRWIPPEDERDWPLHLLLRRTHGTDDTVSDGLPRTMAELGNAAAQAAVDAAIAAFPDRAAVLGHLRVALGALDEHACPDLWRHKISRKRTQLTTAIRLAAGVEVTAALNTDILHAGDRVAVKTETRSGLADAVTVTLDLPEGWSVEGDMIHLTAPMPSDPYPPIYLPDTPAQPRLSVAVTSGEVTSTSFVPLEQPPLVLPSRSATIGLMSDVVNLAKPNRQILIELSDIHPKDATPSLALPQGWTARPTSAGLIVDLPQDAAVGRHSLRLLLDDQPAETVRLIAHDHIAPRALITPAEINITVVEAALPAARIGYIGGGNDRVDFWLDRMGAEVSALSDAELSDPAALAHYDTLIVGIFANRFRDGLAEVMPAIHEWVHAGGTLVTLYHRPWDNWDPDATPPARLEVGQPSLRWRVTDENATVTTLTDHPILNSPNPITAADWDGWHKERGLYFAKSWDAAYTPLLEMADPDEAPHRGALLSADIGAGRHIHCALILHHQMEKGVPGAFRLMANLCVTRR